jgi:hypothetical protein
VVVQPTSGAEISWLQKPQCARSGKRDAELEQRCTCRDSVRVMHEGLTHGFGPTGRGTAHVDRVRRRLELDAPQQEGQDRHADRHAARRPA